MRILGIETSCDETAAAIIEANPGDNSVKLVSNVVASSLPLHAKTGGIIPEVAARQQIKYIIPTIKQTLTKLRSTPGVQARNIDAIAVTVGPGLIGSLLIGVETAKTLSYVWKKPLIPVNHLIGHIYANWIMEDGKSKMENILFPALALIVSGGHTDLVLLKDHGKIQWLGGTRDDAAGECFDKCARLLGYLYPGGPKIAELAQMGDPKAFPLPRPMLGTHDYEFSFSGLKTAFLNITKKHFPVLRNTSINEKVGWQQILLENQLSQSEKQHVYNLCASLENAIVDVLIKKTLKAATYYQVKSLLLSGGVAANQSLRDRFKLETKFFAPPKSLCTDNGAMIATAAFFNYKELPWQRVTADPELYF